MKCTPVGFLISKSDGTQRRIENVCFPHGFVINEFISKEEFPVDYAMSEHVHRDICYLSGRCTVFLCDISSAYRQFLLHLADWNLLVLALSNDLYFSTCLAMGLVSACGIIHCLYRVTTWPLVKVMGQFFANWFCFVFLTAVPRHGWYIYIHFWRLTFQCNFFGKMNISSKTIL